MKKVIIIGSGLGGLLAGNLLAKKGHQVVIFESHTSPGGYTAGFRRQGFYFESGTLSFESSGVLFRALKDCGLLDRVRCVRKKDRWVSPYFDFLFDSYAAFKGAVYAGFPAEKAALDGYFSELDPLYEAMQPLIGKPFPFQFSGLGMVRALLPYIVSGPKYLHIRKKYGDSTVVDLADAHFKKGTPLHRLFSELGYPNMGIDGLGGFFITMSEDYWHVAGGMQQLADALTERFRNLGGELKCRTPVDKILTRDGAAVGVSALGVRCEADAVIAACDYKSIFLKLLDRPELIPQTQREKIRHAPVSEGVFVVYLGLSLPNEELNRHMRAFSVSYLPLANDIDYEAPDDADHFRKVGFSLYSPSLVNPELAPAGRSSLMILAFCPSRWQDNWRQGDRRAYEALKEEARETLVERAGALIPGLRAGIEVEEAATPLTFERYTGNTDGATSAWSWDPRKKFHEGGMGQMSVGTPVKNLLIGSCWIHQMGGIPSAVAAAYLCAKQLK